MRGDGYTSQTGGVCFVMKPETPPHVLGKEGQSLQAPCTGTALPRVPTAVTSTQTMRDGSTFLHHNIFMLNCDLPEGSPFQRANPTTYSQVTAPVTCSPAGSTTQLTCSKHPSPGTGSGHNVPKFPSFQTPAKSYGSHSCYCSHGCL